MNLWSLLERAASLWPDQIATIDGVTQHTWSEVRLRSAALAGELVRLEAGEGERVAILEANSAAYLETYFASAGAGAVLCPLNYRLSPQELAGILAEARPRVLLVGPGFEEHARQACELADLEPAWIALGEAEMAGASLHGELDPTPDFTPATCTAASLAQLYFTSGTTGRPKGVMLTHGNVASHALAAIAELTLSDVDVWAHVAPLFHLADAWATFAVTWAGGRHVFQREFEAEATLELFAKERVTLTNLVPTMLVRVVDAARRGGFARESLGLRLLLSGGAPIAPEVVARIEEVLGCPYAQTYGMTETSPYLTISLLKHHQQALPTETQRAFRARTGRPFLGIDLEVVDESGRPVPRDDRSVGEIRVRGAHVSPGYWNRPEETAVAFRGGWLYTGDLAVIDEEGFVDIVDRKKDMIVTGGENVFSIEVENALHEHPDVLEAAVFARPDAEWGERVCAAVVLRQGAGEPPAGTLEAFCRERLAAYKCPREIDLRAELPRTGSGKIAKRLLREGNPPPPA